MRLGSVFAFALLAACSPYDPGLSDTPFFCGSAEPRCPDGYQCVTAGAGSAVCTNGMVGSGSGGGSGTCAMTFSGTLATWDLTGAVGSQPSSAATTTAGGVTATPITRSATLMPTQASNSISASNWPTTAQRDPATYFSFTITAPSGCAVDLTGAAIDVKSSGTGPVSAAIASSNTSFGTTASVSTTTAATVPLTVTNATGLVELRVFGYSASATTGTMRIENQLSLTGTVR